MNQKLKMYILVKDHIPTGKAIIGVAHASLACYLKFQDSQIIREWLSGPFYKTVCIVSEKEFEKVKQESAYIIISESTLNNAEAVIAFCPRRIYPKYFNFFLLFK